MAARVVVKVDREVCLGNQICMAEAPGCFELDEDGRSRVIRTNLGESDLSLLENAEAMCPTGAITVELAEGEA